MSISTIGIDLAKNVFQVQAVDERGHVALRRQLKREQMAKFFVNLPACLVGMEACGGAHHSARKLQSMGHQVKLVAPPFVKPYVKTNKNDNDLSRRLARIPGIGAITASAVVATVGDAICRREELARGTGDPC